MLPEGAVFSNPTYNVGLRSILCTIACRRHALLSNDMVSQHPIHYTVMSYIQSIYHIIFRTYRSEKSIVTAHERELYAIIMKQTANLNAKLICIGGMPDHIHLLVSLSSDLPLSKYVQAVKTFTSKWLRENPAFPDWNGWGREYAAVSYNVRDKEMIVNYIQKQKEHHRKVGFEEEYRAFLIENGIAIRKEYFLKD